MRVVVHHPARTELDESGAQVDVPESVSAYALGRITDESGVNHLTGETTPKEEVAAALLKRAQAEYPDCKCEIEVLVHNGDGEGQGERPEDPFEGGTSRWVPADQVPEGAVSPKGGVIAHRELSADQSSEVTE